MVSRILSKTLYLSHDSMSTITVILLTAAHNCDHTIPYAQSHRSTNGQTALACAFERVTIPTLAPTIIRTKEQRPRVRCAMACTLPRNVLHQTDAYWLSGLNVRTPASVVEQTPVGSTRTTASSSAQKPRIPVWLIVIGTAFTV